MKEKFGTAINCIDGRIQFPIINYMKTKFGLDFVDIITELAPNKILSEVNEANRVARIKQCLDISVFKHGSKFCAISAHHDCAGNPKEKENQIKQLKSAIKVIKSWMFNVKIIGLWIDDEWKVNEIEE